MTRTSWDSIQAAWRSLFRCDQATTNASARGLPAVFVLLRLTDVGPRWDHDSGGSRAAVGELLAEEDEHASC